MAHVLSEETSLTRKQGTLRSETGVLHRLLRFEAAGAVLLMAAGSAVYFLKDAPGLFVAGVVLALVAGGHAMKLRDNRVEERRNEAGLKGEARVSAMLAGALDNDHYIFNDISVKQGRKSAQIDHLIVCPSGIFILETKNWRGLIEGDEYADRWKQFRAPGQDPIPVANPVQQSARHCAVVTSALQREGIDWPDVHPLVVFTPRTQLRVAWRDTPVLHPDSAVEYIQHFVPERRYSEDEVSAALNYFMKKTGGR